MQRMSVGLLKNPIKTINAKEGKVVEFAFNAHEAEEAFALAA
jgi:hypothetical protein